MGFQFQKLNLLLCEDVVPMRDILTAVLKNLGVENITTAADGKTAFEKFQKDNHDIILTDWVMTPMDGIELTREVRSNSLSPNRMAPIIMLSGYSAWPRVSHARDCGVTEFLIKPFTAQDLARRIAHVITHPRQFVESDDFFGPDRRRRIDPQYDGAKRRAADEKKYSAKGI